ncbi:MAG: ABC transporter permease [Methylacidiphilales bacterium]|nr:ABC transporter permease [Candidatus Methylacidiphilales bacterium]
MTLFKRIAWRLLAGVGVLWCTVTLAFVAFHLIGDDPVVTILGGEDAQPSKEMIALVRKEYGLDRPLSVQYAQYLWRAVHGDLGQSYRLHIPVARAISQQLMPTLSLMFSATLVSVFLAVALALLTAKRAPWIRSFSSGVELVISSAPAFVLGTLLLLAFSFQLNWLPSFGTSGWETIVLPTLALALPIVAVLTQVLRQELEDILELPFIVTARARGLSETRVRLGHALRHALIPLLTLSGFIFASLLGGAVIVETLFSRQGIGRLMVEATGNKDVPMVLGITELSALIYVVVNLIVDLLYAVVDPRVKGAV